MSGNNNINNGNGNTSENSNNARFSGGGPSLNNFFSTPAAYNSTVKSALPNGAFAMVNGAESSINLPPNAVHMSGMQQFPHQQFQSQGQFQQHHLQQSVPSSSSSLSSKRPTNEIIDGTTQINQMNQDAGRQKVMGIAPSVTPLSPMKFTPMTSAFPIMTNIQPTFISSNGYTTPLSPSRKEDQSSYSKASGVDGMSNRGMFSSTGGHTTNLNGIPTNITAYHHPGVPPLVMSRPTSSAPSNMYLMHPMGAPMHGSRIQQSMIHPVGMQPIMIAPGQQAYFLPPQSMVASLDPAKMMIPGPSVAVSSVNGNSSVAQPFNVTISATTPSPAVNKIVPSEAPESNSKKRKSPTDTSNSSHPAKISTNSASSQPQQQLPQATNSKPPVGGQPFQAGGAKSSNQHQNATHLSNSQPSPAPSTHPQLSQPQQSQQHVKMIKSPSDVRPSITNFISENKSESKNVISNYRSLSGIISRKAHSATTVIRNNYFDLKDDRSGHIQLFNHEFDGKLKLEYVIRVS
jgi:hypothetical protein